MAQSQKTEPPCNLLSIVWYKVLPARFGGQKAVARFNEEMGKMARLHCLCAASNEVENTSYTIENSLPVSRWQFLNPLVWRRIYHTAGKTDANCLLLEFPYHGIAAWLCKKLRGCRLVLQAHNVEYLRFRQQGKWWWKLLFYYERWVSKKADVVFYKTQADLQLAAAAFNLDTEKTAVIPYGVDRHPNPPAEAAQMIRKRHGISADEAILLFAGTLDYAPNAKAVRDIADKLLPLFKGRKFRIIICGRNRLPSFQWLTQINRAEIIFAGEVNDIALYFSAADVFINPVLEGGGIQTKIMDALSCHLSVVCFQSRSKGIEHAGNKLYAVADDDWHAFSSAINQSIGVKTETPAAFFEKYNWRTIAAQALQKICSV